MPEDTAHSRPRGAVRVFRNGVLVGPPLRNLFVDSGFEVLSGALANTDYVRHVIFAQTGGRSVVPDLRGLPGLVLPIEVGTPVFLADSTSRRTRVRWTATDVVPPGDITYDTLGLTAASGLLVAAVSWPESTALAGENIAVEWTLNLRG